GVPRRLQAEAAASFLMTAASKWAARGISHMKPDKRIR
ncbi:MAG: hypothetical protein ACI93G_001848, partial [Hyphomonas sp.]